MDNNEFYFTFSVPAGPGRQRLDAFLGRELEARLSREKLKKAITQGRVRLNGQVCLLPRSPVRQGDRLELDLGGGFARELAGGETPPAPENKDLNILYQDADLAVLNKPAGLTVHPCPSCPSGTLVNRLLAHFPQLALAPFEQAENSGAADNAGPDPEADFDPCGGQPVSRPGIVHRLDKDTTGLLLVALHEAARLNLAAAFAARSVGKEYLALVYGVPSRPQGRIEAALGRHPRQKTRMATLEKGGREALSEYRTLYADPAGKFALLAVRIHTGRTHQVRVHLHSLGHPIIGDSTYFDFNAARKLLPGCQKSEDARAFMQQIARRPLLHAWKISFSHPGLKAEIAESEMHFTCPPPPDFYQAARRLSHETHRLILTGNVGCGKSSVLALLRQKNLPVWSADQAVAEAYQPGGDGWQMLQAAFNGRFTPHPDQGVDKKALFEAMYNNESLRREIERLVHPIVIQNQEEFFRAHDFWQQAAASGQPEAGRPAAADEPGGPNGPNGRGGPNGPDDSGCPDLANWPERPGRAHLPDLTVAEVPLFFEAAGSSARRGNPAHPLLVLGIHCPQALRRQRLQASRGWPEAMIAKMESWQWDEDKKMQACDLVLDNSGPAENLEAGLNATLNRLAELEDQRLNGIEKQLRQLAEADNA